jgi:hypothetical protein
MRGAMGRRGMAQTHANVSVYTRHAAARAGIHTATRIEAHVRTCARGGESDSAPAVQVAGVQAAHSRLLPEEPEPGRAVLKYTLQRSSLWVKQPFGAKVWITVPNLFLSLPVAAIAVRHAASVSIHTKPAGHSLLPAAPSAYAPAHDMARRTCARAAAAYRSCAARSRAPTAVPREYLAPPNQYSADADGPPMPWSAIGPPAFTPATLGYSGYPCLSAGRSTVPATYAAAAPSCSAVPTEGRVCLREYLQCSPH